MDNKIFEKRITKKESGIPFEMYETSGIPKKEEISEHSFNRYLKDKKQDDLILREVGLEKQKNINSLKVTISEIRNSKPAEQFKILKNKVINGDLKPNKEMLHELWRIPEEERLEMQEPVKSEIMEYLDTSNSESLEKATKMVWFAKESDIRELRALIVKKIKDLVNKKNFEDKISLIDSIKYLPFHDKESLIEELLKNPDKDINNKTLSMVWSIYHKDKDGYRDIDIISPIAEGILSKDLETKKILARMFKYVTPRMSLVGNKEINIDEDIRNLIFGVIKKNKDLRKELVKSDLYDQYDENIMNKESVSDKKLDKTGSETTLIWLKLKEKSILRHIKPSAFLAWQKIYENYKLWQENKFDYVPIEPIQSYKLDTKKGLVDVYSGVLDLNLSKWLYITDSFKTDLINQKKENY
jgi:hypothetical protein